MHRVRLRPSCLSLWRGMSTSYKGSSKFVASMISDMQKLAQPKDVHVCDGSAKEAELLIQVRNWEFSRVGAKPTIFFFFFLRLSS
jgi:GTP-dependent phosphoenolpyruvate carboxykinase